MNHADEHPGGAGQDPVAWLASARPEVVVDDGAERAARLARDVRVQAAAVPAAGSRGSRGWRPTSLAALVACLVLVPGTAVAAVQLAARTGVWGRAGDSDASERINVCAQDFPQYVASLPRPAAELPAGVIWPDITHGVVHRNVHVLARDCTTAMTVTQLGVRADIETVIQQRWECAALAADDRGQHAEAARAAGQVAAADERLDALGVFRDGNWRAFHDRAARGDIGAIRASMAANGQTCPVHR